MSNCKVPKCKDVASFRLYGKKELEICHRHWTVLRDFRQDRIKIYMERMNDLPSSND